ncbi:hypothetical protein [Acidocella aminolytica]|uniref:Uncharacterized protein n=1 Tax=Acidocella aminolytica 101 = DSM 11237 TaxID=1120923 RepID=A0A0D6PAJ5_9PROT|nr:hypothetical protein [Acidocella aminolytica]GAN78672.1 hypothetical protein Aam_005_071 [Acidocella aminolytica 101 = DSM 11237]GBQ36662.1 hypothetical protein AA11237_1300 [Acidocella aminolytica 101 = DSM 11237]SHE44977.1 hypothetical protein SAMN02746095_00485 [Acidocella aminolytica 101 = DSM 11237]
MRSGIAIIGIVIMALVVFFAVPMLGGGSANVCQALEKHNVSQTAKNITGTNSGPVHNVINSVGQSFATGDTEAAKQHHDHPDTPSAVSCAASYWKSL